MNIPFFRINKFLLQISDGVINVQEFMEKSQKIVPYCCIWDWKDAKMQLLQYD